MCIVSDISRPFSAASIFSSLRSFLYIQICASLFLFSMSSWSLVLDFPSLDIRAFTRVVALRTGRTIVVSPEVTGAVTLYSGTDVPDSELFPLYLSLLHSAGFTVHSRNGIDTVQRTPSPKITSHVFQFYHRVALPFVPIVERLIRAGSQTTRSTSVTTAQPSGSAAVSAVSHLLYYRSTSAQSLRINRILMSSDIVVPTVAIRVIVARFDRATARQIGIDYSGLLSSRTTGDYTSFSPTSSINGFTASYMSGLIQTVTGDSLPMLSLVLRALQSYDTVDVLSTPSVLLDSDGSARLSVGRNIPLKSSITDDSGIKTTAIVRSDVGVILDVTASVHKDERIQLSLSQSLSSVSPIAVAGASDLVTDQQSVSTHISVVSGDVVLLGGLASSQSSVNNTAIPYLSSVPYFGSLFGSHNKSSRSRRLFVFLQAIIVSPGMDLVAFSSSVRPSLPVYNPFLLDHM